MITEIQAAKIASDNKMVFEYVNQNPVDKNLVDIFCDLAMIQVDVTTNKQEVFDYCDMPAGPASTN